MKVRAKEISNQKYAGYYDHKRRISGEVFVLSPITKINKDGTKVIISPENQFSDRWMEKIEKDIPVVKKTNVTSEQEVVSDDVI